MLCKFIISAIYCATTEVVGRGPTIAIRTRDGWGPAQLVSGVVMPPVLPVSPRYPTFPTIQIRNFNSLKDFLKPFLRKFLRYDAGKDDVFYTQ